MLFLKSGNSDKMTHLYQSLLMKPYVESLACSVGGILVLDFMRVIACICSNLLSYSAVAVSIFVLTFSKEEARASNDFGLT